MFIRFAGDFEIGAQYHFHMEPQTTFAFPNEEGGVDVYCATQYMDVVHIAISRCLKVSQSKVNIFLKRIGGGYGGKISQCSSVACASALGSFLTRQPVRFVLTIESNMRTMGKRYSMATNYEATVDSGNGRLLNLSASITEDYGNTFNDDVSFFTMESFSKTCYARPTEWKIKLNQLKTDAPSSTWCRAPGSLEGSAIQENLMEHIARETNLDPAVVRLNNLPNDSSLKRIFPEFVKDTGLLILFTF